MSYTNHLFNLPTYLVRLFRQLENTRKKICKAEWSTIFNNVCLQENLLPSYTRMRYHDPALAYNRDTIEFRKSLVKRELANKKSALHNLKQQENHLLQQISLNNDNNPVIENTLTALDSTIQNSDIVQKSIVLKKLNNLYNGQIILKNHINYFTNLSDYQLTDSEKCFLNLGLSFHVQGKYDRLFKQTELEILYNNLIDLEKDRKITVNPNIKEQLAAEGTKHRNPYHKSVITPQLRAAATSLKNNSDIIIRKADKSTMYVILNRTEYISKINSILADRTKFKPIVKDPTIRLKQSANKLISTLNAVKNSHQINKIIGDFTPGYIYGNVKTHKPNNPLRPIISQCPTPTYKLAKTLNKIITPYIPNQYSLQSTNDFIDLIHSNNSQGIIASLDVESLFTNVPIDQTIAIILSHVYNHASITPPKIPQLILKQLLEICTKESPFRCPSGHLYLQIEGVAMGSPLGPTFANFYMGNLENIVFNNPNNKPHIYARYVDDIFIQVNDVADIVQLKQIFEHNSVLKFTYELNTNNKLPFLDVNVTSTNDNRFKTTVYRKPTNIGTCLNANSECPEQYKTSVISNFIHRIYKITQNWSDFHIELQQTKQMLINNNYSNHMIDTQIRKFLNQTHSSESIETKKETIDLFYHNQMHRNYKIDERVLTDIIHNNVSSINPDKKVKLHIYYKNRKAANFIIRNNLSSPTPPLLQTGLIYEFKCPFPHGQVESYIGLTQTTLKQRLLSHTYKGSIHDHFVTHHGCRPNKLQLEENTSILSKATDRYRLSIKEALFISQQQPSINRQFETFTHTLKLFRNSRPTTMPNNHQPVPHNVINNNSSNTQTLTVSPIESTNVTINPNHLVNSPVSPFIQSRIDRLYHNTLDNNQQTPIIRRLRNRNITILQS